MRYKYLLILIFIAGTIGTVYLFLYSKTNKFESENFVTLPSKVEAISETTSNDIVSPDGKMRLTIKSKKQNEGTNYSFYVNGNFLFTKFSTGNITIPFNTWSTNDKSFLIREEVGGKINFFVESDDINVTEEFYKKFQDYKLQDVTGWAAQNLLVINANDGNSDISLWFDTSTKSFIRLSNRFN